MATNPLEAAAIFGAPMMLTPEARAEWERQQRLRLMQQAGQNPLMAAMGQPAALPFAAPSPQQSRPANGSSVNDFMSRLGQAVTGSAPQDPNEPNAAFAVRRAITAPSRMLDRFTTDVAEGVRSGLDTPAQAAARERLAQGAPTSGGSAFPISYKDPLYANVEAQAAQQFGGPYASTLAALLGRIRTMGERSNANQVNQRTGASTPYQITSDTRAGIQKNYGFDPWANPLNAAKGSAIVLLEQAGAFKKGGVNLNDPSVQARAVGGYFGGSAGAANPFGSISDGISTAGEYTQRVLGSNTGLSAPFLNPYDPSYDAAALGQIGREEKALKTPFSMSMNVGPAPELPQPEAVPTTDFSKSDEALAAMRPVEMSEKERLKRERTGYWSGIGQAMMGMSGNEGIGTFFMKLGGGALAGRFGADKEIEKEQDRYEDKLSQYNAAVYNNEWAKAKISQDELKAQADQNNSFNQANWKIGYSNWLKNSTVDISGTNAVINQSDPRTGQVTVRTIPIGPAVDAAIAQQRAGVFQSMGGRQMGGNQQITGIENGIMGRAAIMSMQGNNQAEADGAAAAAPAFYGTFIAGHGLTADLLGAEGAKSLEESVGKQLMGMGMAPGSQQYIERHDRIVATELAKLGLASPEMMQKMMSVGAAANSFEQSARQYSRSERTSTDSKGRQTTSTTYNNASDIFD